MHLFILLILTITLFFTPRAFSQNEKTITIGSKSFTESHILAEILATLLEEKYSIDVERKFGLGGTKVAFDALKHESVDVYPDYTGTGYVMILKQDGERDPDKVFQIVSDKFKKKWNIEWSNPLGFNNTFALAVRKSDTRLQSVRSISDLKPFVSSIKFAVLHEFLERRDGFDRLIETYQLDFDKNKIIGLDTGLAYSAIKNHQADLIVVDATDGRIASNSLRLLKDDLKYFPPYFASYLAQTATLNKFPELREALELLAGKFSEKEMTEMNDRSDRLKQDMKKIARNFLIAKGLLEGTVTKDDTTYAEVSFFTYLLRKRAYVLQLLGEHLLLSFGAIILALLIALPVGVLLSRYKNAANIVFPVVNIIQTIPSLALLGFMIPLFGIGFFPALVALFLYSLLPLIRNTYAGIQGVDRTFVEVSKGIGLTNMQILLKVELPLALPIIISGLRTAAVLVIGTATLAALIGAGGFGDPIFRGVSTVDSNLILLGAIPAALLAVTVDKCIGILEIMTVSPGIKLLSKR